MPATNQTIDQQFTTVFDHVVSTAERVGIPIATFGMGAWALFFSTTTTMPALAWVGGALIVAALATYVWLTERTTIRVQSPPSPLQPELVQLLEWMQYEVSRQAHWARERHDPPPPPPQTSPAAPPSSGSD
jgi:hypothetical protein